MNDSYKSELLSAYLDHEISAEEQAEIEQLLETDPQARQLLEELSQVGELLRDQHPQHVRPSFTGSVMNRVRQQASHGNGAAAPAPAQQNPAGQQPEPGQTPVTPARRGETPTPASGRSAQRWLWASLAAAAALLLLTYPLGLFDFLGGPVQPRIAIDQPGNPTDPNSERPGSDPLVGHPEPVIRPDPGSDPRVIPDDPAAPGPGAVVEVPRDPGNPGSALPLPGGSNVPSPFVGGFTEEDEKILRLLESLVLVKIECTPATANAREFDKILKKYKIKLAEKATPKQAEDAPPPETEVYYIEASVEQAEAVLNEVNSRKTEFTSIAMRTETLQLNENLNANPADEQADPIDPPADDPAAPPAEGKQPARAEEVPAEDVTPLPSNQGRGSFAERFQLETPEELAALRNNPQEPLSASSMLPFLHGQGGLDSILGPSPVEAEHLVRMLVVLDTVTPKPVEKE